MKTVIASERSERSNLFFIVALLFFSFLGCAGPRVAEKPVETAEQQELARFEAKKALLESELAQQKSAAKLHELAALHLRMKNPQACLETLGRVREVQPEEAETRHLRASAYKILGKKDLAQTEWEAALKLDPGLTKAHYNLGVLHYEEKRHDDAEKYWKKTVELDPTYSKAHYNLGVLLHSRGKIEEARDCYANTLKHDPGHVKAHINKGLVCAATGTIDGAIECWGNAVRLDPKNYYAHYNLGLAYAAKNDFDKAVAEWNLALETQRNDPWLYFNIAMAYDKKGDVKKAIDLLRQALEIKPDFEEARVEYRSLLRQHKKAF